MAKRKVAAPSQSTSLFDFFAAPSCKKAKASPPKATLIAGASVETALVIDDSDDEGPTTSILHTKAPKSHETPQTPAKELPRNCVSPPRPSLHQATRSTPQDNAECSSLCRKPSKASLNGGWLVDDDEVIHFDDDDVLDEPDPAEPTDAFEDEDEPYMYCPICSRIIDGQDEDHINKCLDAASSSKRPTPLPSNHKSRSQSSAINANAFSVLMSNHKENVEWKVAELDSARASSKIVASHEIKSEGKGKGKAGRRLAPFYKVMQGMPVAVDAFRYGKIPGVTSYFLTHAHSDHYTNLSSSWNNGPIYCSETTANLVKHMLRVDPKWVYPLPFDVPTVIPDSGGVSVTLIEANHCPGSALYLFEGPQTVNAGDSTVKSYHVGSSRQFRYLHCGDYRASPQHVLHPRVKGKKLDLIYLDTTYLDPKYCFPPQKQVIDACAALARRVVLGIDDECEGKDKPTILNAIAAKAKAEQSSLGAWMKTEDNHGERGKGGNNANVGSGSTNTNKPTDVKVQGTARDRVLVVVGTYSIGKERVVKAIAHALSTKIYCDPRKTALFKCQDDPELHALMSSDPLEAFVHVVPLQFVTSDKVSDYLAKWKGAYERVVAFRPTGWTYTPPVGSDQTPIIAQLIPRMQSRTFTSYSLNSARNSTRKHTLYGVPYSEHSSFFELTCFALSVDWTKMIATVNVGSEKGRAKMGKWFERWDVERRRRRDKGEPAVVGYRSLEYW